MLSGLIVSASILGLDVTWLMCPGTWVAMIRRTIPRYRHDGGPVDVCRGVGVERKPRSIPLASHLLYPLTRHRNCESRKETDKLRAVSFICLFFFGRVCQQIGLFWAPTRGPRGSTRWGSQHPPYLASPFFRFGKQTQGGEAKSKSARNDTINQFNWNVRLDRRIEVTILPSISFCTPTKTWCHRNFVWGGLSGGTVRKCLIPATNAAHRLAAWRRQNRVRGREGHPWTYVSWWGGEVACTMGP